MRKHLDKAFEDAGTTHGPSSISSVSDRVVSKGSKKVSRRLDYLTRPLAQSFSLGMSWVVLAAFLEVSWLMQSTK